MEHYAIVYHDGLEFLTKPIVFETQEEANTFVSDYLAATGIYTFVEKTNLEVTHVYDFQDDISAFPCKLYPSAEKIQEATRMIDSVLREEP